MPLLNAQFLDSLSEKDKDQISDLIEEYSKISVHNKKEEEKMKDHPEFLAQAQAETSGLAANYEMDSRRSANRSRTQMADLSEESKYLLRFYGKFGLVENGYPRAWKPRALMLERTVKTNLDRFKANTKTDTAESVTKSLTKEMVNKEFGLHNSVVNAFKTAINSLIDNKSGRLEKSNYLHRISRAKKHVYCSQDTSLTKGYPLASRVKPGDIVTDEAFLSTAPSINSTLYRYSEKGMAASNKTELKPDEEEILYIIEHNDELKSLNIAGFKFKDSALSSGEVLLQSNAKFRVLAIEDSYRSMHRRSVVLKPELNIASTDFVKNIFNGETAT